MANALVTITFITALITFLWGMIMTVLYVKKLGIITASLLIIMLVLLSATLVALLMIIIDRF
jgi:hypothetical protein